MSVVLMICMILCLLSSPVHVIQQGNAVFYDLHYVPSACYGIQDNGNMVAGVSGELWNNGGACGKSYKVECIGGANATLHPCKKGQTMVVKVVDYCKSGCHGIINLSRDAFSTIVDPDIGIV
ncbi:plant natriuretic peptide A [Hibiscus trionum]|uniref:Plant natriuretic peptide A n=1 Tax=Hibiscus trionum TaxID=183268 RepID=A0A9W7LXM3_HIBTR|nr:plant natriuretic peptide A [Hibiscus trionum]